MKLKIDSRILEKKLTETKYIKVRKICIENAKKTRKYCACKA